MARSFNYSSKFSLGVAGIFASMQALAQMDTTAQAAQTAEESPSYAFIGIGAALLIIVIIVLYRRQYRKFNE